MSVKKFISGISAFAVAVTAFAAMVVTASATEYTDQTPTTGASSGVTAKGNGVYTTNSAGYAGVVADLSTLTDIDRATSITVSFRTTVPTTSATSLVTLMYGVGDKDERGLNLAGSFTSHSYVKDGLVSYFGAETSQKYYVDRNTTKNWASSVAGKTVDAQITLNRETGDYTTKVQLVGTTAKITETGTVAVGTNITVVEAFTAGTQGVDITLSNIKVSYTVPDEGAAGVAATGTDYTGTDGTKASLWNGTVAANAATKVTAVATLADGVTTASGETPLDGLYTGDVEVYVIVNKAMAELSGVTISFE